MEQIIEFDKDTEIDFETSIENLVYDGIYVYSRTDIHHNTEYNLFSRFSFNTKNNVDFGYILFEYTIPDDESMQELLDVNHNKVLISDFGLGLVIRSDLFKDKTGYYYYGRSVNKNMIFKVRVQEWQTLLISFINHNMDTDKCIPLPTESNLIGVNYNTNDLDLIRDMVTINFKDEYKDSIEINKVVVNKKSFINEDNEAVNKYTVDCTIPTSMFNSVSYSVKGLRLLITLNIPKAKYKQIKKNMGDLWTNDISYIDHILSSNKSHSRNKPYVFNTPIVYEYNKTDGKNYTNIRKIGSVLITYNKAVPNMYAKFNIVSNFNAFAKYLVELLGI